MLSVCVAEIALPDFTSSQWTGSQGTHAPGEWRRFSASYILKGCAYRWSNYKIEEGCQRSHGALWTQEADLLLCYATEILEFFYSSNTWELLLLTGLGFCPLKFSCVPTSTLSALQREQRAYGSDCGVCVMCRPSQVLDTVV